MASSFSYAPVDPTTNSSVSPAEARSARTALIITGAVVGVFIIFLILMALTFNVSNTRPKGNQEQQIKRWAQLQAAAPERTMRKWCKEHESRTRPGDDEEALVCVICLETMGRKDHIRALRCKHIYHSNCFDQWFSGHDRCPLCHRSILEEDLESQAGDRTSVEHEAE